MCYNIYIYNINYVLLLFMPRKELWYVNRLLLYIYIIYDTEILLNIRSQSTMQEYISFMNLTILNYTVNYIIDYIYLKFQCSLVLYCT